MEDSFKMPAHTRSLLHNSGSLLQSTVSPSTFGIPSIGDSLPSSSLLVERTPQEQAMSSDKNPAVQNLIDSLFPVLSRSLQTIKEKTTQAVVDEKPSVNAAMAFALGDSSEVDEKTRKKIEGDAAATISPVSLTNPKGLSEHQEELINIAAGLTEFDENFLPVTKESVVISRSQSFHEEEKDDDSNIKRSNSGSNNSSSRHRHRSHRRSSSRSPSRRSSHRSSKDGREERRSDKKRSSRRSPSPRRRKGSRGRLSSSKDGDDNKRSRHSPDSGKSLYYNNRRSPTPEMDSSAPAPFSQQNLPSQQQQQNQQQPPQQQTLIANHPQNITGQPPLVQNQLLPGQQTPVISVAPQANLAQSLIPTQNTGLIPPQSSVLMNPLIQAQTTPTEMNKPTAFSMHAGMLVNATASLFSSDPNNPRQQNMNRAHDKNDSNTQETTPLTSLPQVSTNFQQQQTTLAPVNHLHTIPSQMNFDGNIRAPLHTIHTNNSLRLLQQQGIKEPPNAPIQLPQISSRIIPFNAPHFVPMNTQQNNSLPNQVMNPNNASNQENISSDNLNNNDQDVLQHKNNSDVGGAPMKIDNQNIQTRPRLVVPPQFDLNNPPLQFPGSPPPFPGAPPVPPPFLRSSFPKPNHPVPFNASPEVIGRFTPRDVRPHHGDGAMLGSRSFIPENIRPHDVGEIRHRFNQPEFERPQRFEMRPHFRPPRFDHGEQGGFRPRARFIRPRLPFQQRPMM